jgi:hypothetical protein
MPSRSIHPYGDRAKGTFQITVGRRFYLKVCWPTPRIFRLEIDRGFDDYPIEKFLKWDVTEMVRDTIAFDPYLPGGQRFKGLEGFRNQFF